MLTNDALAKLKKIGRVLESIPAGDQRAQAAAIIIDAISQEFGTDFPKIVALAEALRQDRNGAQPEAES